MGMRWRRDGDAVAMRRGRGGKAAGGIPKRGSALFRVCIDKGGLVKEDWNYQSFFFKSEFVFCGAHDVVQRQSLYVLCLGVCSVAREPVS
jgi:hypothetical protein